MKILDRYLLRAFAGAFLGSLISVAFLFTVLSVLDSITYLMNVKGATLGAILHYYLLQLPQTVYMSAPVAVLLSAMITLGSLNQRHELTAMRAAGLSLVRAARPLLAAAVVISVLLFVLGNTLVPFGNRRFLSAKEDMNKDQVPANERIWYVSETRGKPPAVLRIEGLDRGRGKIQGITVLRTGPGFALVQEIAAESAVPEAGGGWRLFGVKVREFSGFAPPRLRRLDQMFLELPDRPQDLLLIQRAPEEMTLAELNRHLESARHFGRPRAALLVERQSRFAIPLAALILTLVGAPLAVRPVRSGGLAFGIVAAIIVGFIYFVIIAEFLSLAKAGLVSPLAGAWSANLIFGIIGGVMFSRLRR